MQLFLSPVKNMISKINNYEYVIRMFKLLICKNNYLTKKKWFN